MRETDGADSAMDFTFHLTCGCEDCSNLKFVFLSVFTKLFFKKRLQRRASTTSVQTDAQNNERITVELCTDVCVPRRIPNDFGGRFDSLTFIVAILFIGILD